MNDPYASKPWLKHYDKHISDKLTYTNKLYSDLFSEAVGKVRNRVAIYYHGLPVTYDQLDKMSNKFANFLNAQGAKQGDVVGINLPNVLANYISIIGILKAGCVVSGVSPLLTPKEIEFQLNNSGVKILVTIDALWGNVRQTIGKTGVKAVAFVNVTDFISPAKVVLGKLLKKIPKFDVTPVAGLPMHSFMDILKNSSDTAPVLKMDNDANCMIQYTGGTTGLPKGAIITHKNFVSMLNQLSTWFDCKMGQDVMLLAFPLFHMAGLCITMWGLSQGSTMIAVPNPRDYDSFIKSIKKYKPTIMTNVATLYIDLLTKKPEFSKCDFSNLSWCFTGAMSMPPEYFKKLEAIVGENKLIEGLGMTETSPLITMGPRYGKKKIGSVGLPVCDTEIKVVDPVTKEVLPVGESGELIVKGPQVFYKGYLNMPEETANTLRDGWIYTGDIVRMDEDGYVFVSDRLKDMVNVSGFKVFTRELDDLITEHPAVNMAATIGLPNPERPGSEMVVTAVVLKPGFEKSEENKSSIIEHVKKNAAPYKVPKMIVFMDQLPTSAVGKILKRELREMLK